MKRQWPATALGWRDYYAKRWARANVDLAFKDVLLQMALFHHFMALLHGEIEP